MAGLFRFSRVCKKKSDSDEGKKEEEALIAATNDEADRWRKTRRE